MRWFCQDELSSMQKREVTLPPSHTHTQSHAHTTHACTVAYMHYAGALTATHLVPATLVAGLARPTDVLRTPAAVTPDPGVALDGTPPPGRWRWLLLGGVLEDGDALPTLVDRATGAPACPGDGLAEEEGVLAKLS